MMPVYDYRCDNDDCDKEEPTTRLQRRPEPPECPKCGKSMERIYSPQRNIYKGSGWTKQTTPAD